MTLRLANALLHGLHLAVIAFATFGWLVPAARPWHLALAAAIAASWFVLGPVLGEPGYCALTGLQHAVWRRLEPDAPRPGYMAFLCQRITGRPPDRARVERWTQGVFYATTAASLVLWLRAR